MLARALALLLTLLVLLAACGQDAATDDGGGDDEAGADDPEEPDDPDEPDGDGADGETDDAGGGAETATNPADCVDDPEEGTDLFPEKAAFEHLEHAAVAYHDTYKVLEVTLPFDGEPARYVLAQCGTEPPALEGDLADASVIEVPVDQAITATTANIAHFDELGAVDRLIGVGNTAHVTSESAREAIEAGDIEGYADAQGAPDIERVIAAEPDVAVIDAFGETVLDTAERLGEAGVPALLNADFTETSPLARAEWVKVTGLLLNQEAAAADLFDEIAAGYEETAARVAEADERPLVLHGEPFEGTWYAPGGESVTARAIEDAGGEYVFADDDSTESIPLDLETVLDQGANADVWVHAGSVNGTLGDLGASDERFASIEAFERGEVWAADAATNDQGGNAMYESGYLRADEYLADLAAIFHPDLIDHDPVYFGPVPEG